MIKYGSIVCSAGYSGMEIKTPNNACRNSELSQTFFRKYYLDKYYVNITSDDSLLGYITRLSGFWSREWVICYQELLGMVFNV